MYLFRALSYQDLNNEGKIVCKNANSKVSLNTHVRGATRVDTRFVSATKSLPVSLSYAFPDYQVGASSNQIRTPIILIDTDRIKENNSVNIDGENKLVNVYDLTDEEVIEKELKADNTKNYARASCEVVFEYGIPDNSYRVIPELLVDILYAFEDQREAFDRPGKSLNVKEDIQKEGFNNLNDILYTAIMEDNVHDLERIIENVELSKIEKIFLEKYYGINGKERKSMDNICKDYIEGVENIDLVGRSIKISLIKKIVNSKSFLDYITEKANDHGKDFSPSWQLFGASKTDIIPSYVPLPEACMTIPQKGKENKSLFSRTAKIKNNNNSQIGIVYGGAIAEKWDDEYERGGGRKLIPIGISDSNEESFKINFAVRYRNKEHGLFGFEMPKPVLYKISDIQERIVDNERIEAGNNISLQEEQLIKTEEEIHNLESAFKSRDRKDGPEK